jgi:hypothetical protein
MLHALEIIRSLAEKHQGLATGVARSHIEHILSVLSGIATSISARRDKI